MATEAGYQRSLSEVEQAMADSSTLSGFLFVGLDETGATATAGVNPDAGEFDVVRALGLALAASAELADVDPAVLGHAAIQAARQQHDPIAIQNHDLGGGFDVDG